MKDPPGVSPSKGNQGTTRGKEKNSFDIGGNRTHRGQNNVFFTSCGPGFPLLGLTPSGSFMGFT